MTEDKAKTNDAPKKPKRLNVRVLRAVDAYHVRGVVLSVPDDEYHQGLLKQGNLRLED
jgi:hypothetical protein